MNKRKRKPKPGSVLQASGAMLFRERDGSALRQCVRAAIRDPLFYMRRDMRAQGSDK